MRIATHKDKPQLIALAHEALSINPIPGLIVSKSKIFNILNLCVGSPQHFVMVAEQDNEIQGAVVSYVGDMSCYERKQAALIMVYCKIPGEGIKMVRSFLKWARGRSAIKLITVMLDARVDPRVGKMFKRLGLHSEFPVYSEVR